MALTNYQRFFIQAHGGRDLKAILAEATDRCPTLELASKDLGISEPTLRMWMKECGLDTSRTRNSEVVV
jgi:hypothetical protein